MTERSRYTWGVFQAVVVLLTAATPTGRLWPDEPEVPGSKHPLDQVLPLAERALAESTKIKDYSARLVKREWVYGKLSDYEYAVLKVRHEPFSVYMRFLAPESVKGREVIYVEGQNDGKMLAHETGVLNEVIGTVALWPDGPIAMRGQRYPITEIGIKNLGLALLADAERDRRIAAPCEVRIVPHAKVDGRLATLITVHHTERRAEHSYGLARVYLDDELNIPIRFEGYQWPDQPGAAPRLVEEYTYSKIRLNQGFTDRDFDPENPAYNF